MVFSSSTVVLLPAYYILKIIQVKADPNSTKKDQEALKEIAEKINSLKNALMANQGTLNGLVQKLDGIKNAPSTSEEVSKTLDIIIDKILVAKDALGQQEVQIAKIQLNVDNLLGNIVTAENPANVLNLLSSLSEDEYNKFLNYLSQIGMTMASASGALYAAFMAFRRKEEEELSSDDFGLSNEEDDSSVDDLVNHETHENHEREGELDVDNVDEGDDVGLEDDFVDGLEGSEELSNVDFGLVNEDGKTQSDAGGVPSSSEPTNFGSGVPEVSERGGESNLIEKNNEFTDQYKNNQEIINKLKKIEKNKNVDQLKDLKEEYEVLKDMELEDKDLKDKNSLELKINTKINELIIEQKKLENEILNKNKDHFLKVYAFTGMEFTKENYCNKMKLSDEFFSKLYSKINEKDKKNFDQNWNQIFDNNKKEPLIDLSTKIILDNVSHTINHTVKKGDTLYQIANKYNTTVEKLKTLNSLTDNDIKIGDEIKVSGMSKLDKGTKFTIEDSLYGSIHDVIKKYENYRTTIDKNTFGWGYDVKHNFNEFIDNYANYFRDNKINKLKINKDERPSDAQINQLNKFIKKIPEAQRKTFAEVLLPKKTESILETQSSIKDLITVKLKDNEKVAIASMLYWYPEAFNEHPDLLNALNNGNRKEFIKRLIDLKKDPKKYTKTDGHYKRLISAALLFEKGVYPKSADIDFLTIMKKYNLKFEDIQ